MLDDKDFIKSCDVPGPTKEAIRAIILYKSDVKNTDKVVDCGCGTGGITCEFAQRAGEVISIDTNPEAIEITSKNLEKFGLGENVTLINDNGANALKDIDNIDIAIVGGSGRELENILDIVHEKLRCGKHQDLLGCRPDREGRRGTPGHGSAPAHFPGDPGAGG